MREAKKLKQKANWDVMKLKCHPIQLQTKPFNDNLVTTFFTLTSCKPKLRFLFKPKMIWNESLTSTKHNNPYRNKITKRESFLQLFKLINLTSWAILIVIILLQQCLSILFCHAFIEPNKSPAQELSSLLPVLTQNKSFQTYSFINLSKTRSLQIRRKQNTQRTYKRETDFPVSSAYADFIHIQIYSWHRPYFLFIPWLKQNHRQHSQTYWKTI